MTPSNYSCPACDAKPLKRQHSEPAKQNYPIVQVSVFDSINNSNTLVEAPSV
jgi:hypothetical protein